MVPAGRGVVQRHRRHRRATPPGCSARWPSAGRWRRWCTSPSARPTACPTPTQVRADAAELGVELGPLVQSSAQVWGEQALESTTAEGGLRVVVIGRDATDAQFMAKLVRFVWFKDSGPSLSLSRTSQIEHRAYLLLLAERAGVLAPRVMSSGTAGGGKDALLVMTEAPGRPLAVGRRRRRERRRPRRRLGVASPSSTTPACPTRASPPTDCACSTTAPSPSPTWPPPTPLPRPTPSSPTKPPCSSCWRPPPTRAAPSPRPEPRWATTRSPRCCPCCSWRRSPAPPQKTVPDARHLTSRLRDGVAEALSVEPPALVQLHRVSIGNMFMAAGTIFGVYLLIGQFSEIDWGTTFQGADLVLDPRGRAVLAAPPDRQLHRHARLGEPAPAAATRSSGSTSPTSSPASSAAASPTPRSPSASSSVRA